MSSTRVLGALLALGLASCASQAEREAESPEVTLSSLQRELSSGDPRASAKFFTTDALAQRFAESGCGPDQLWFWRVSPGPRISRTFDWPLGVGDAFRASACGPETARLELLHRESWPGDPRPKSLSLERVTGRWLISGFAGSED